MGVHHQPEDRSDSPAPFSSPADAPTSVVTGTSKATPTSDYVIRTPGPQRPLPSPRPASPQWSPGPLLRLSAARGPPALELPHKPVPSDPSLGPCSCLSPDQSAVPSGLVKDTASSPHTPPAASAVGWPAPRGTLTQTRSDPRRRTEQSSEDSRLCLPPSAAL